MKKFNIIKIKQDYKKNLIYLLMFTEFILLKWELLKINSNRELMTMLMIGYLLIFYKNIRKLIHMKDLNIL